MKIETTSPLLLNRLSQSIWSRTLACVGVFSMLVGPVYPLYASEGVPPAEDLEGKLGVLFASAEYALTMIDPDVYDLSAAAEKAGREPGAVREWVAANTSWVPYRGLLRGAMGTLAAREGNSLDRVILLAELLKRNGHEVRIVHATVPVSLRKVLEGRLRAAHRLGWTCDAAEPVTPDFDEWASRASASRESLKKGFEESQSKARELRTQMETQVEEQSVALLDKVGAADRSATPDAMKGISEDHYWVRVMDKTKGAVDICLIYGEQLPPALLAGEKGVYASSDEIPEEWIHKVSLRWMVAQEMDGKEEVRTALEYEAPAWTLANRQVQIGISGKNQMSSREAFEQIVTDPDGFAVGFRENIRNENEWVPFFQVEGREDTVADKQFNANGDLASPSGDVIGTGKALGGAMNALGGLGLRAKDMRPEVDEGRLTRVSLEFATASPGQPKRVEVRDVYRSEADEWENGSLSNDGQLRRGLALMQQRSLLVQVGRVSEDWVAARQLQSLLSKRLAAQYLLKSEGADDKSRAEILDKVTQRVDTMEPLLHGLAVLRYEIGSTFIGIPNLVSLVTVVRISGESDSGIMASRGIDWIQNPVQSMDTAPDRRFEAVLRSGVRDTVAEVTLLKSVTPGVPMQESTVDAFRDPSDWSELDKVEASFHPETARGMANDQKNGFMLIADRDSGGDQWWRVNPETGETLGMARVSEGVAGAAFTEYNIKLVVIALNFIKGLTGYYNCARSGAGAGCFICQWLSASIGMISMGVSSSVGLLVSSADATVGGVCNLL